jgi:hypothetical protein
MVGFLGWLGNSFWIKHRFWNYSQEVAHWNQPTTIQAVVKESVEEQIVVRVATRVDTINMNLSLVLDNLRSPLRLSPKDRKRYLRVDPLLPEIPTDPVAFVEPELSTAKHDLQWSVVYFLQDLTFEEIDRWVPSYYKNPRSYYNRAVFGNLSTFLVCHMVFAYGTFWVLWLLYPACETIVEPYVQSAVDDAEGLVKEYVPTTISIDTYIPTTQVIVWTLILSLEAYLYSSLFIGVVYFFQTSPSRTVQRSNQLRQTCSAKTNDALRQAGISFFCRDILQIRMGRAKRRLLKLIHYSYKLEMIRDIVDGDTGSVGTSMTSISSSFSPTPASPPPCVVKPSAPPASADTTRAAGSITNVGGGMAHHFTTDESISNRWKSTFSSWRGRRKSTTSTKCPSDGNTG